MGRLNVCIVLALVFVRISPEEKIKVFILPNRTTFYSEINEKPSETITCESDCQKDWKCIYSWYIDFHDKTKQERFTEGKILFLNKTVERDSTFNCEAYKADNRRYYGYSDEISVFIRENRPATPTTHAVSVIQSSANTVYSHSTTATKNVKNDESFPGDQFIVIISICAAAAVLLIAIAVLVGILCVRRKQRQNKIHKESRRNSGTQKKDHGSEMTENILYITADNVAEIGTSNSTQNNTPTTGNGNDVYAVVDKTRKTDIPVYAEIRNSQLEKEKPAMTKKPSGNGKNKPGRNENKEGMVYVEIDFKDMPSNGESVVQGEENKTLHVDIDSTKHADPLPESEEDKSHAFLQNGRDSNAE